MKLYRVQAKYNNIYVDEMLEAKNDKAALECFVKKVDSGVVTEKNAGGFLTPDKLFITFEEVDVNVSTRTSSDETSVGVQMGEPSIKTG
tara:strand:- start:486 stop:752 length:267 start_codon:yes stop_codon:yes gene_type:complete